MNTEEKKEKKKISQTRKERKKTWTTITHLHSIRNRVADDIIEAFKKLKQKINLALKSFFPEEHKRRRKGHVDTHEKNS